MKQIIAENITRLYHNRRGLQGVSLSVTSGQCLAVLGANGSGKTTLTRLIAGIDRADSGKLLVLGHPAYPRPQNLRSRCGVALDTSSHWDSLSGRQNLSFFVRQYGLSGAAMTQKVDQLLFEADLQEQADEPITAYSLGMRRKLSIIEALSHNPDLLILDEPSAGIDDAFLERLAQRIARRCRTGATTWIADNNTQWLCRTATDILLLVEGRAECRTTAAELTVLIGAKKQINILLDRPGFTAIPNINGIDAFRCDAKRLSAELNGDPELPAELLRWISSHGERVRSMELRSMTFYDALTELSRQRQTIS